MWSAWEHFYTDHPEVGLPHIRADEFNLGGEFLPDHGEESLEGFHGPLLGHPEEPGEVAVDLVDQREIFVSFGVLDLIDADRPNGR